MENILDFFKRVWDHITVYPISDLTIGEIFCIIAGTIVLFFLLKKLCFAIKLCLIKIFPKFMGKLSAKERAKKINCKYCGRNLHDCICQKNKGLSDAKRIKLFKREKRALKNSTTPKKSNATITFSRKK